MEKDPHVLHRTIEYTLTQDHKAAHLIRNSMGLKFRMFELLPPKGKEVEF